MIECEVLQVWYALQFNSKWL